MEEYKTTINKELTAIKNDKIIFEHELSQHRDNIAFMLKNGMGEDMDDVLSGKKIVQIPFWDRVKYKISFFLNKLFNTF